MQVVAEVALLTLPLLELVEQVAEVTGQELLLEEQQLQTPAAVVEAERLVQVHHLQVLQVAMVVQVL
jgi:hypothetical protein